jgi:hypothetical protein
VSQALEVGMDRVRGDAEIGGDGELGAIVEHAANDLQFTFSNAQAAGNL